MDRRASSLGAGALALRICGKPQMECVMRRDLRLKRDAFLGKIGSRPLIMGILNVTPDSFSDGGRFLNTEAAITHARAMVLAGCDIVDVGGESVRPGATPVSADDELARVEPVLVELAQTLDVPLSIDTAKAGVAARAAELGAVVVNDVWGLQRDPAMADVVAAAQTALIVMHNRAEKDEEIDIVSDMRRFFDYSLALATAASIPMERIILDIGIGFGKTGRQNRDAVARLDEFADYGLPILVGVSRKSFLGSLTGGIEGSLIGTVAANLAAAAGGASIFRVHDVAEHVAAFEVFHKIRAAACE
jgi:dihydropteroate synthase